MWDSEDSDSDSGIRFKTTSTRKDTSRSHNDTLSHKRDNGKGSHYQNSSRRRSRSRDRRRSNSRSRSRPKRRSKSRSRSRDRRRSRSRDRPRNYRYDEKRNYGRDNERRDKAHDERKREKSENRVTIDTNKRDSVSRTNRNTSYSPKRTQTKKEISKPIETEVIRLTSSDSDEDEDRRTQYEKRNEEQSKNEDQMVSPKVEKKESSISLSESEPEPEEEDYNRHSTEYFGPALPPTLSSRISPKSSRDNARNDFNVSPNMDQDANKSINTASDDNNSPAYCGPQLPPPPETNKDKIEKRVIGPTLPPNINLQSEDVSSDSLKDDEEDSESECIGPKLIGSNMTTAELELEKRALELKLAKLESGNMPSQSNIKVREEWMLELPEVNTLRNLGPAPRQFKTREGPDFSDRSSWTDTPQDKEKKKNQPQTQEEITKSIQEKAKKSYEKARDAEQEKMAKKHKKKHKRDESLLEMHQKKLKKQKKKEEKEKGDKIERRPFSREVDLKVNKFDQAQKNSIIRKAQLLDTRFSTGEAKYL